jgi:hypothetical protein
MEGDLVAVVQDESIIGDDGLHDIIVMDIFVEGHPDQLRRDWIAWQLDVEIRVPKRATEAEMNQAVLAKLQMEKDVAEGTDRQRVPNRSNLVNQDIRLL